MTRAGWIFMAIAWVGATGLVTWCYAKLLRDRSNGRR